MLHADQKFIFKKDLNIHNYIARKNPLDFSLIFAAYILYIDTYTIYDYIIYYV